MATATKDIPRNYELGDINELPVVASDIIYEGSAVSEVAASGHMNPLAAGEKFVGFCLEKCDNSAGGAAAKNVKVLQKGKIQLTLAAFAITDNNAPVYASDDTTFTLTSTSNSFIGYATRFVSDTVAIVNFDVTMQDPA